MLFIYLIGIVAAEFHRKDHRISSVYRNNFHYLKHFCACSSGNYTLRTRFVTSTKQSTPSVRFMVYDQNSWEKYNKPNTINRALQEPNCNKKEALAVAKTDMVEIPNSAKWSQQIEGSFPRGLQGMFYFAVSDCTGQLKAVQYEVGYFEMEIITFNGNSPIDERFNNLIYMHLVLSVLIGVVFFKIPRESFLKSCLKLTVGLTFIHNLVECLNYEQNYQPLHILSEEFISLAFLIIHFLMAYVGWGLFVVHERLPTDEMATPFTIMFLFLNFMFTLVFNVNHKDPDVFHNYSGIYGRLQLSFRIVLCLFGLTGLSFRLNKEWKDLPSKKYKKATEVVLTNCFFIGLQIACFFGLKGFGLCHQHYVLLLMRIAQILGMSLYLMWLPCLHPDKQYQRIVNQVLPI